MKTVILKELTISNWRSLNLNVRFNSTSNEIKGANGVGKSSLQNAQNWLLHGYCEPNQPKNHELFDNKVEITNETPIASVNNAISEEGITILSKDIEKNGEIKYIRPDGKVQVTVEYNDGVPVRIDTVVVSTQHDADVSLEQIFADVKREVIETTVPAFGSFAPKQIFLILE